MRKQTLTLALAITAVACIADIGAVQGCALYAGGEDYSATAVWVTATAAKDHLRFASLGIAQRMRLQILSQAGDLVFDSDFRDGNLLDWQLDDGHGNRLPDGVYGCLITVEDIRGQFSHRRTLLCVTDGMARFESLEASNAASAASSGRQDIVAILRDDEELPMIQLVHDGESGRIVSGKGGLSFRVGNALVGKDVEYMRLTADGDLGVGVAEPAAKLDVAGMIHTQGIMFSDGTVQKTAGGAGVVAIGDTEQRLSGDGTLLARGKTGTITTATNSSRETTGAKNQMLTAGKSVDPVNSYEGENNTFYGYGAGAQTTGDYNAFFGAGAGPSNTTGSGNSFFGHQAGLDNSTGNYNSFFGLVSGLDNTTGYSNSFFGVQAGLSNGTGCCNSFFGQLAGNTNGSGNYNSFFGYDAGTANSGGSNNTCVGALSNGGFYHTNATAIGYRAEVAQDNSLVLGSINGVNGATADTNVGIGTRAPSGRLHVKGGDNELLYVGATGDIGIGTVMPDKRVQVMSTEAKNATLHLGGTGDAAKDIFAGMGESLDAGPAFNYGYAGYSFGRSAGFFNVRPDPSAVAPNPSLRFMTANQQRMIITNTGNVGIGTTSPKTGLQADNGAIYVGSPGEGIILRSPDGLVCVKLTVSNTAALVSTPMACP